MSLPVLCGACEMDSGLMARSPRKPGRKVRDELHRQGWKRSNPYGYICPLCWNVMGK